MAIGFKIADGYVEVHADYNRRGLQRSAQQAADDFGRDFSRRSRANFKKSGMAAAGQQLGRELIRGATAGAVRETPQLVAETVTVVEREVHSSRTRTRLRRVGSRMADRIRDGLIGPDGAGRAAGAFVTRFVEAITLGMADLRYSKIAGPMAARFAVIGTSVGLALAVALMAKAANAITALTPLLLGALAIIPIKFLAKTDKEVKKSIKSLKSGWKGFMTDVSKPLKPGLLKAIENIKAGLEDLKKPVGDFFGAIGDALPDLSKGAMKGIENFFKAIGTEEVKAGLKEWGKQLPGIGQALGDMIAAILKDPETTVSTVKSLATDLKTLAESAGSIISALAGLARGYEKFADQVDRFEQFGGADSGKFGPLTPIFDGLTKGWAVVKPVIDQVIKGFKNMADRFIEMWRSIRTTSNEQTGFNSQTIKSWVERIAGFFTDLRNRVVDWVKRMWSEARASFTRTTGQIAADVSRWVTRIITFFTDLRTRVVSWVNRMWSEARASFTRTHAQIAADVSRWVQQIVGFFTNLRTRVISTATSMMTTVRSGITTGLNAVRSAFTSAVNAIRVIWDRIRAIARTPVAFVVNTVLNDGLLRAVRAISSFVGYGPGKNIKVSMASGGVLPGYTPGRDVHRFYSISGGQLDLSGGEGIARPEIVRAVGTNRWNAANKAAARGHTSDALEYLGPHLGGFAQGGTLNGIQRAEQLARSMGITSIGTYAGHHPSAALARDFMTKSKSQGDRFAEALWANRKAIHLWYEIWYRRIRSMTREGAGWQAYTRSNPHTDHVHGSWYPAGLSGGVGALSSAGAGGGGFLDPGKYLKMVTDAMAKLSSIKDTPWGSMAAGAATKIVGAVKDKITSLARSFVGSVGGAFTSVTGGSNRAIGHKMMLQRWGESQWPPLNSLWTKESGWRTTARNPSSGAYGIPQSLPASKMASAGSDWRTNPATQIKWGLGYIAGRYGTPSAAWAHSQRTNWYGGGGVVREPVLGMGMRSGGVYGFGERGPETVTPGVGVGRTFSPTINVNVQAGLDPIDAGARRALVKALWLELDSYEKDYMRR